MDGFSVVAPETWSPEETNGQLVLTSPSENSFIVLEVLGETDVGALEGLERSSDSIGQADGLDDTVFLDEISHPDGDAALWTVQGSDPGGLRMMLSMVALKHDGTLVLAGVSSTSEEWDSIEEQRRYAFESFQVAD